MEENKNNDIVIYQTEDGITKIEVNFNSDTVWLAQAQIGELFQRERSVITKHINNVFEEHELEEKGNVQILTDLSNYIISMLLFPSAIG